jgi:hypothetical protein
MQKIIAKIKIIGYIDYIKLDVDNKNNIISFIIPNGLYS